MVQLQARDCNVVGLKDADRMKALSIAPQRI